VVKRAKLSVTVVHYDHAVPFAYLNSNPRWNWVAACNICNLIKGDKMFHSIQEIRMHVLAVRERRRHVLAWVPPVSSEQDPERWAVAFASFLAELSFRDARQIEKDLPSPLGAALSAVERTRAANGIRKPTRRDVDLGGIIAYGSNNRGAWPWSVTAGGK